MRIGIDARFLGDAGGIARYVKRLVQELERVDRENEYVIFLRRDNWNEYTSSNPRFSKYCADIRWYGLAEQLLMPLHIKRAHVDLMHFPHWNIPLLYRKSFIVTIHDLILFHFPSTRATTRSRLTYAFKQWAYRRIINHAVRAARHIMVPSEYTKQDIIKILRVSPEKITVTHEGVDAPHLHHTPEQARALLNTFGIHEPYLLYVGVAYPHKNLEWLAHAVSAYNISHPSPLQLVLVGASNYFYERIKKEFADSIQKKELVLTGFIPDADLGVFFMHASVYVFPSLYEGFGLPPLQALAYKTPVLSSNQTCMPEILGNAALYFNPTNMHNFSTQLDIILNNQSVRAELIKNGIQRYQQFSWARMAEMSLRVYQK